MASALASNTPTGPRIAGPVTAGAFQPWRCRAARRRRRAAGCRACRPHRFPRLRTARRRRCPCRHCAAPPRAGRAAATAASTTCRRRSGWRASARRCRRRTARHGWSGMNDQVTASIMPRTASARLAARVRICSVVRILPLTASWLASGCGRDLVDAVDAHDLLDEIGLAVDVGPPRRNGDVDDVARIPRSRSRGGSGCRCFPRRQRRGRSAASPPDVGKMTIFGSWPA